ncbi:VOC family protein [Flexibacterium corallicola]|uniref:VOC family protein n=1 Tax=Flexibacterium corallicola TaxID=3037259 RepID=UPI00286F0AD7|nr:VOC family protein [Pseudovibrio sp. M1P-2-3]
MVHRGFQVRSLGEVVIRTNRIVPMLSFYRDILGLVLWTEKTQRGTYVFSLGESGSAHGTTLVLHDAKLHSQNFLGNRNRSFSSSLHHIALNLPADEIVAARRWLEVNGLDYRVKELPLKGANGIFVNDPDGNTVELVSQGPALQPLENS